MKKVLTILKNATNTWLILLLLYILVIHYSYIININILLLIIQILYLNNNCYFIITRLVWNDS